jgi:hypothetical protein
MKKLLLLMMPMFLVGLILGSVALAKGGLTVIDGTTMIVELAPGMPGFPTMQATTGPLAPSGGPSLLLPGAALLLGTGVLTYSVLRRGR